MSFVDSARETFTTMLWLFSPQLHTPSSILSSPPPSRAPPKPPTCDTDLDLSVLSSVMTLSLWVLYFVRYINLNSTPGLCFIGSIYIIIKNMAEYFYRFLVFSLPSAQIVTWWRAVWWYKGSVLKCVQYQKVCLGDIQSNYLLAFPLRIECRHQGLNRVTFSLWCILLHLFIHFALMVVNVIRLTFHAHLLV